ncbi:MAG: PAS domain-containing sensor histidine kinase [Pedobacter sp.]|nr:MAG: PAS domain-containing sensor histidine kinase [Pedobacter sp.]
MTLTPHLLNQLPFLNGGGQSGLLIRSIDWSNTDLGAPDQWSVLLKQSISLILHANTPMSITWGPHFIQFYNDAFSTIIGDKHPGAMGGNAKQTFTEIWGTTESLFDQVMNGTPVTLSDVVLPLTVNGNLKNFYFDFAGSALKDEQGNVQGTLIIAHETTVKVGAIEDRINIQREINHMITQADEESAKLAAIIESSDDAIISKTLQSIITSWNASAQRIFGYTAKEMIGESIYKLIPPDRTEEEPSILSRLANGERVEHFETKRLTKDGRLIDVSITISPIRDNKGNIIGLSKIARDITELKLSEEKSAKLVAIIESSDDAIISKTLESIITSWNDSAQRIFGFTAEEMIGETIYKLIPTDRTEEELNILGRLKQGERVEHFETKRLTKEGLLLDVSLTVSPIKDVRGNIIGLSKIARDITQQKLEEQRKNDFVAMVSHELKTPLTTISSYVQLLLAQSKKDGDEFRINALTRTEAQTKKMTAMIHDFLSLARLDEGKIPLNKTVFELHVLVEEVMEDVQLHSPKHQIELIDCEEIMINADRDKIGQVINNLLTNAIKYSPNNGKIILGCEKKKGKVKVYVKDHGVGINENEQSRLFQRFYRSNNEKVKMVSGFGIGLYLVSEILRFHGSKIELNSKENVGSTFFFVLDIYKS